MADPTAHTGPPAIKNVTAALAELHDLGTAALRNRYLELYGEPTRSRNAAWLRRKLAWRVQELAEGGLSDRALARIDEVLDWVDTNRRRPVGEKSRLQDALPSRAAARTVTARLGAQAQRDPRLPPAGTVLRRTHAGRVHEVEVLDDGFNYDGERFDSLSKAATAIGGSRRNGFRFFKLTEPWVGEQDDIVERGAA